MIGHTDFLGHCKNWDSNIISCHCRSLLAIEFYQEKAWGHQPHPADPIFWMHHANIDRIWSIFQDKNQTQYPMIGCYSDPNRPCNPWVDPVRPPQYVIPWWNMDGLFHAGIIVPITMILELVFLSVALCRIWADCV